MFSQRAVWSFYFGISASILLLCTATPAQNVWTKKSSACFIKPDSTWGPTQIGGQRLAAMSSSELYLVQGDSLYYSQDFGNHWKTIFGLPVGFPNQKPILDVSSWGSRILWNNFFSYDSGKTWNNFQNPSSFIGKPTQGILSWGEIVLGGHSGYLSYSQDSAKSFKSSRNSFTSTYIKKILDIGTYIINAFSLDASGKILVSEHSDRHGWRDFDSIINSSVTLTNRLRRNLNYKRIDIAKEDVYGGTGLWDIGRSSNGLTRTSNYFVKSLCNIDYSKCILNAIPGDRYSSTFPESTITAFDVTNQSSEFAPAGSRGSNSILWVGTWGQGVFVSRDSGYTWVAKNSGLSDLHIEALLIPGYFLKDTVLIINKDGLHYSSHKALLKSGTTSGIAKGGNTLIGTKPKALDLLGRSKSPRLKW